MHLPFSCGGRNGLVLAPRLLDSIGVLAPPVRAIFVEVPDGSCREGVGLGCCLLADAVLEGPVPARRLQNACITISPCALPQNDSIAYSYSAVQITCRSGLCKSRHTVVYRLKFGAGTKGVKSRLQGRQIIHAMSFCQSKLGWTWHS